MLLKQNTYTQKHAIDQIGNSDYLSLVLIMINFTPKLFFLKFQVLTFFLHALQLLLGRISFKNKKLF